MRFLIAVVCLSVVCIACGDDDRPGGDASTDLATDTFSRPDGNPLLDAMPRPDATPDANRPDGDITPDGDMPDGDVADTSGGDTQIDGAADATPDGDIPNACSIGAACTDPTGCLNGEFCITPQPTETGGPDDMISNLPATQTQPIAGEIWTGGYCGAVSGGRFIDCNVTGNECGSCATCVGLGGGTGACFDTCVPNLTDNSDCRDGYACSINDAACLPGCTTDIECTVIRQESNGQPGIQSPNGCVADPEACGCPAGTTCGGVSDPVCCTNFDNLVYDATAGGTCNLATARCEGQPSTATADAGDACTANANCEERGLCVTGWPNGGYCTKLGCDVTGNGCAGQGVCNPRVFGSSCLAACTFALNAMPNAPASWVTNNGGCAAGYACVGDGVTAAGGCIPGEFNAVTVPNVGAACTEDSQCYSPFGFGGCNDEASTGYPGGYCSASECGVPGAPADMCGAGNECVNNQCFQGCTAATDCRSGSNDYGCVSTDPTDPAAPRVCFPGCAETSDCRVGLTCSGATASSLGTCN